MRITFSYRNHRQEVNERDVTLLSIMYLEKPGYGYEPGWFLVGYDHDRADERVFKFENIIPAGDRDILVDEFGEDKSGPAR